MPFFIRKLPAAADEVIEKSRFRVYIIGHFHSQRIFRLKSISNSQADIFIRRHISMCRISVVCIFVLTAILTATAAIDRGNLTGTANGISLCSTNFELPDDAAFCAYREQLNVSKNKNIFPQFGFLPGNLFIPHNLRSGSTPAPRDIRSLITEQLTAAIPVRAGPAVICFTQASLY